jgi:FKBP-type peptidyl-prolyl cis-trans isomerase
MAKGAWKRLPQFEIAARTGPAPKKLVVNDLRVGHGAVLKRADRFTVDFAGSGYGHAYKTTPSTRNRPEEFVFSEVMTGWKRGLPGMKVGGRRELIVPVRLGTAGYPVIYLIDLLAVHPRD